MDSRIAVEESERISKQIAEPRLKRLAGRISL
jgi:hypothetical protein